MHEHFDIALLNSKQLVYIYYIYRSIHGLVLQRLVAISGCGHLPHEECPKALLSALSPFISRLHSSGDALQIH